MFKGKTRSAQLPAVKEYIRKELRRRGEEFTEHISLTIHVGSLNLGGQEPTDQLDAWLLHSASGAGVPTPDIYAVGFQELVPLNAGNVVVDGRLREARATRWEELIKATLNKGRTTGAGYQLILCSHLVGLCLLVFVAEQHLPHVSNVDGQATGVGILGMMGNKGACATRLQIYDSSVCFVCSHLAAHRSNIQGRNKDFANIISRTRFSIERPGVEDELYFLGPDPDSISILDHDVVVWLGDLNYRFQQDLTMEACFRYIADGDFGQLLKHDQLTLERDHGRVFDGFEEGPLLFPPTYKFLPGTDDYDDGGEDQRKQRMPAWTDRILWRQKHAAAGQENQAAQLLYQSCADLKVSDHRPVLALFKMQVSVVNRERQKLVCHEIIRVLDMWENKSIPKMQLDSNTFAFGDLHFGCSASQTLRLSNPGSVPAVFSFVPKMEERDICQSWLQIKPVHGVLMPGSEQDVFLTACVDARAARAGCEQELNDIIVLHVENGSDYFVMLQGKYSSVCFGASLDLLPRPDKVEGTSTEDDCHVARDVPRVFTQLVSALKEQKCWAEPDIFIQTASATEFQKIREHLDSCQDFEEVSVLALAEALLELLMSLTSPLVPVSSLSATKGEIGNVAAAGKQLLVNLPESHRDTYAYITEFLHDLCFRSSNEELPARRMSEVGQRVDVQDLAATFSRCFLQLDGEEDAAENPASTSLQKILHHLLAAPSASCETAAFDQAPCESVEPAEDLVDINDFLA